MMSDETPVKECDIYRSGGWNSLTHRIYLQGHATLFGTLGISLTALSSARVLSAKESPPLPAATISIGGVDYDRYPTEGNPPRMAKEVVKSFIDDTALADKTLSTNLEKERLVLAQVLKTVSPEMRRDLNNIPGSAAALETHDPYAVWPFLLRAATVPGPRRAMNVIKELCELKLTGTSDHSAYAARLRAVMDDFTHLFTDRRTGALPDTVSIPVLCSTMYLNGIVSSPARSPFQFIVDKTLAAVVDMADLPDPGDLIETFHAFSLNLQSDVPDADPVMGYVADSKVRKAVPKAPLAARKCTECRASFVPLYASHLFCQDCAKTMPRVNGVLTKPVKPVKALIYCEPV